VSEFIKVAELKEIPPGSTKHFEINGTELCVVNLSGTVYAISDVCTHKYCRLSDGYIEGENIICPCHLSVFSLKTGKVLEPPASVDLAVYKVRIEGNDIEVEM